jgi:hypothetical protein
MKPNLDLVSDEAEQKIKAAADDPFAEYRLSQDFVQSAGVKKLLTMVPVRKPNPQKFIRVHPSPNFRRDFAALQLKEEGEIFFLTPAVAEQMPGECHVVTLFTVITRQSVLTLWPCRVPVAEGRRHRANAWHQSAMDAALKAMSEWIRVQANMSLGGFEQIAPEHKIPEPQWPDVDYDTLLQIGIRSMLINSIEHPVIQELHGKV